MSLLADRCPASGSDDAYTGSPHTDMVECHECGRNLYLTKHLRLPNHATRVKREQ